MRLIQIVLAFTLFLSPLIQADELFPIKGEVQTRVNFWTKVYTEITTQEAFLHDSEDLGLIYKTVDLPKGRRSRIRFLRREKRKYRALLRSIAKKRGENLSADEKEVWTITGERSPAELYRMARNLRFQYGLRDRYYKGLIRSYRYMDYIEKVFAELNLPQELKFLPHVESSFNYQAYSKVGAAGIWQFMRSTARHYHLHVGYVVDERKDVIKATKAAAQLLRDNYRLLESWPLALTAYNHGARSIKRAIRKVGSKEIHKIIENYNGRRFGFASKNFYATFMATVQISKEPEKYFNSFKKPQPFRYRSIELTKPLTVNQVHEATDLSKSILKEYNPSIRGPAFNSPLYLPKNFVLHIPPIAPEKIKKLAVALKETDNHIDDMELERLHIVSRGESLYDISRGYNVSLSDLIAFNQIPNPSRIYAGMKIKIPGKGTKISSVTPKINPNLTPAPEKSDKAKAKVKEIDPKPPELTAKGALYGPLPPPEAENALNLEGYNLQTTKLKNNLYRITIETEETLGHLAEWAGIRTQKIRDWNGLAFGGLIYPGQKLKLWLSEENLKKFTQERNAFHLSIQEDFYENFKIVGYDEYKVKRGDTLTEILRDLNIPFWLLRKVQDDKKLSQNLKVGQVLKNPQVEPLNSEDGLLPVEDKIEN